MFLCLFACLNNDVPTLMAISVVIAMRRYYTARISRWRRSRAFNSATKHRHRASTCSNKDQLGIQIANKSMMYPL